MTPLAPKDDHKSTTATKLPLSDTNEFIHILNQFNAEWQQAMKDQAPTEQEEHTVKDVKKQRTVCRTKLSSCFFI
jgi:hypothetical protein